MEETNFEFTPEQRERLREQIQDIVDAVNDACEVIVDAFKVFMDALRKIAENLARFFLKQQLLEWRIPEGIADFISEKMYSSWVFKIGFNWFERKLALRV